MKQDVINLCIEQAAATIHAVNDAFLAFVRDLGGFDRLPEAFTLDVPTMKALETAIDHATAEGDLQKTQDLCDEYKTRFTGYIAAWRKKVEAKNKKGARI